jgi:hypothetical protein
MTLFQIVAAYESRQTTPDSITARAGAITPRGNLNVAVYRLTNLTDTLSCEDREYARQLLVGLVEILSK